MTDDSLIEKLLDEWQERVQTGRPADLTEICSEHPQLLPAVKEKAAAFAAMDRALRTGQTTVTIPGVSDTSDGNNSAVAKGTFALMLARPRYRVVRFHAKGGLGEVLVAHDEQLHRQVAIKRMQGGSSSDSARHQRFLREASITGQLDHPGVVSILNVGEDEQGNPCYAMKFIDGKSLDQYARELHEPFAIRTATDARSRQTFESHVVRPLLSRFVSVCNTIAFAHNRGVIHRDLKPANVMLGDFGATYVVDWGLARTTKASTKPAGFEPFVPAQFNETVSIAGALTAEEEAAVISETLTHTGAVMGTPAYMSPEQASGDVAHVGPQSDIYCLGATLYFLLTGRAPIASGDGLKWLEQLKAGTFPKPRAVQPLVPAALESICLKAMSLKPADRYPSALDFASDIERWLADEPVSAHMDSLSTQIARFTRRHRAWAQVGGLALLVIALLSTVFAVLLNRWRNEAVAASEDNRKLYVARDRDAIAMRALAEKEAESRRVAEEQRQIAEDQSMLVVGTMRQTVIRSARLLENVEGAANVRKEILSIALQSLRQINKTEKTEPWILQQTVLTGNDIARVYLTVGGAESSETTKDVLKYLLESEKIVKSRLVKTKETENDELGRDISVTMELIGDAYLKLGQLDDADKAYAESLAISERRLANEPTNVTRQQDAGFGYEKVGDVLLTRGNLAEAKKRYQRSLEIYQQIVKAQPEYASYQRDLLVARSKLGNIERREGNLDEAAATFRSCVETCEALEKIPKSGAQRRDRSVLLNKLGMVLFEQSKTREAAEAFSVALQIAREAVEAEPTSETARGDLAISLKYMGDVSKKDADLVAARTFFNESLAIRRELVTADQSSQVAQVGVAAVLTELGDLEIADGKNDVASPLADEAISILNALKDAGKLEDAEAKELLNRATDLRGKLSAPAPN